jgi:hypothetical protein
MVTDPMYSMQLNQEDSIAQVIEINSSQLLQAVEQLNRSMVLIK